MPPRESVNDEGTIPVAEPFSNVPVDGVSVTLQADVPTHRMFVVPLAWMIALNLSVAFCVWLNATSSSATAGSEHVAVPVTTATPVFALTATFGSIASVTVANRSSSNAPMSHVTP